MPCGASLCRISQIKDWAYINRPAVGWDQQYIFSKQLHAEHLVLSSGVEHIVAECPCLMNCAYAQKLGLNYTNDLINIAKKFGEQYPSLDILLQRTHDYQQWGRYHDEDAANQMGDFISAFLKQHVQQHLIVASNDYSTILSLVVSSLEKKS